MNRLAILGATGSIGTSSLDVARAYRDRLEVVAVSANRNWRKLAEICREFSPRIAILAEEKIQNEVDTELFPKQTELRFGTEAITQIARAEEIDTVIAAIVGAAGLESSYAAVDAGKRLAIANKETLVVAGPIIVDRAEQTGAELLPVDSEHSAIFQALQAGKRQEVSRIILTSSGGPFRGKSKKEIATVTPEQALQHPTWNMGEKITIDSATMMNKALEIIEARWLFGLPARQIEVAIHQESFVHSMVEFTDGSVIAQMSPPDMRLPIQYALSYPHRWEAVATKSKFDKPFSLHFSPPDFESFPALRLGFDVATQGGTTGAVLNACNEVAVSRFLHRDLSFYDIPRLCRELLDRHDFISKPTIEELEARDQWARKESYLWKP